MRKPLFGRIGGIGLYAAAYIAFLYGPVLFIPLFSFNDAVVIKFPLAGFTTKWYAAMFGDGELMRALGNSLKVGGVVAVISTVLGTIAAKAVTRYRMPGRGPVVGFIMSPLVLPGIIMGVALLIIFNNILAMPLSLFTIGFGHTLICLPFAMAVMMSRLEGFDKALEEASLDLGESGWMTFWRVTFPLAVPGVIASLLLSFTTSFDEFIMAFFLAGNETTLPIFIYSQMRFPARLPMVLALGALILLVSFVLVILALRLTRRGMPSKAGVGI